MFNLESCPSCNHGNFLSVIRFDVNVWEDDEKCFFFSSLKD